MNPVRTAAVALAGAAVLGLAAPAAAALVEPDPMAAGQRVSVSDGRRCAVDRGATAASPLFGSVVLEPAARGLAADTRVAPGATPGHYRVTVDCGSGGGKFTETVTVRHGRADGVNASQAAGGLALLALAGGAAYLLRRNANART
ncbi:hypothetical protein ACIRPT_25780 [Streptomyces sp. NPDC101227]|uniref:hypothetical protein n=1 Tax=Streptomyces sp. NPDC101227 TaxID=3366136 RepID=UPI003812D6E7